MAINEYRRHAAECLCIADEDTTSPENRMLLVGVAQAWIKLAQRAEQDAALNVLRKLNSPPIGGYEPAIGDGNTVGVAR